MPTSLEANVLWRDSSSLFVRCPHCSDIHRHGFDGKYQVEQYRVSHCGNQELYKICFPLHGQYEIDKARGFYVRAGADPTDYFARLEPFEEVDVSGKRKWYEAEEEVENHGSQLQQRLSQVEPVNRLQATVSAMVMGRTEEVQSYLATSAEKDIFLHGVQASQWRSYDVDEWDAYQDLVKSGEPGDVKPPEMKIFEVSTSGKTALHLAACEKHPKMAEMLLEHGADPNARMVDGRTPLMDAALWGRLDNVRLLLHHGADKAVQCVRKGARLRAIDFAKDTKDNRKERYELSGGEHQVYKEVTSERDEEREAIVRELSDDDDHSCGQASVPHRQGFACISVTDGGGPEYEEYDHGIRGRFYACHAEKQLGAYFVNKHMFLPCDVDEEDFGMSALSLDDLRDHVRPRRKVMALMGIEPPQRLRSATILVSRAVCDDCRAFVGRVNEALGLDIEVRGAN